MSDVRLCYHFASMKVENADKYNNVFLTCNTCNICRKNVHLDAKIIAVANCKSSCYHHKFTEG